MGIGFQVTPPLDAAELEGFDALDPQERAEVLAPVIDCPAEIRSAAIVNAMWRKAHPGWRRAPSVDTRKVYFIVAETSRLVKIGVAADPVARLRQIAAMSPESLRLAKVIDGGRGKEKDLHDEFSAYRMHGEWFRMEGAILAVLEGAL